MSKLRAKLPAAVKLNKPVVFSLVAALSVLVGFTLVEAFTSSNIPVHSEASKGVSAKPAGELDALPTNYNDRSKIEKYFGAGDAISPAVKRALDQLHTEQQMLEARFAKKTSDMPSGPQAEQAMNSGLFFPGSAPETNSHTFPGSKEAADKEGKEGGDGPHTSDYQLQNMQVQKLKFLMNSDKEEDVYNPHKVIQPATPFLIQAGTIIPGSLLTSINSSLPGNIVAQVRDNVYDTVTGQYLLIPRGSKIIGQYDSQVAYGQERVLIAFTRVIRPDGTSIVLDKLVGTDAQGNSGLAADVDNHWSKILGAAVISTMLSVGAGIASDRSSNGNTYYQSSTQNALQGGAGSVSQTGQALTGRAMNVQPTLTVPAGFSFDMIVNKDVILTPYQANE